MSIKTGLIVAAALVLPMAAFAQSADTTYCKALSAKYREMNKGAEPNGAAATAMSQCDSSPGSGIPVLEKALTDEKVTLPKRG